MKVWPFWIGDSKQNIPTKLSHWRGQTPSTLEHWGMDGKRGQVNDEQAVTYVLSSTANTGSERTTPKAVSWGVYVRTCVREDKCECTCCWQKQMCESAHLHVILLASLWLLANSLRWACFTSARLWRCVHGCNLPEPECEADFTELSGCRLSSLWACIKRKGGGGAYLHPYHLAVK